jgi:hypothetical protein
MSKGEINRDFYCSANDYIEGYCDGEFNTKCGFGECENYHRKWPTEKQFKEEYGRDWDGGGYYFSGMSWIQSSPLDKIEVCACTPWGKPPDDWRPE